MFDALTDRFDGLFTLALVAAGIGAWWLTGGRIRAAFVLPLAALLAAFLAYVSRFLAPYAALPLIWISVNRAERDDRGRRSRVPARTALPAQRRGSRRRPNALASGGGGVPRGAGGVCVVPA